MFLIKNKDVYVTGVSKDGVTYGTRGNAKEFDYNGLIDALMVITGSTTDPVHGATLDGSIIITNPKHRNRLAGDKVMVKGRGLLLFFMRRGISQKTVGLLMGMSDSNAHNAHHYLSKDIAAMPRPYFDALRKKYPGIYHYVVKPEKV